MPVSTKLCFKPSVQCAVPRFAIKRNGIVCFDEQLLLEYLRKKREALAFKSEFFRKVKVFGVRAKSSFCNSSK